ncbi:hypothetical protein D9M71_340930 [compost metagenome]
MQRNRVVLPQPEGPSRHTSSPAATSRETSCRAVKAPKRLWIPRTFICAPGFATAVFMAGPHRTNEGHARRAMRRFCGAEAKVADSGIGRFWCDLGWQGCALHRWQASSHRSSTCSTLWELACQRLSISLPPPLPEPGPGTPPATAPGAAPSGNTGIHASAAPPPGSVPAARGYAVLHGGQ